MANLAKQEITLSPSEIIVQMQSEMFKGNLTKEVEELAAGLLAFTTIETEIQAASANGILQTAKRIRKIGEDKRKEKTASLDNTKKTAIEAERLFFQKMDAMISAVSGALLAFKQEQQRKANEEAERIRLAAEKEASRKRSPESIAKVQQKAQEEAAAIVTPSGMRKTWVYEVEDIAKVPANLIMVNDAAIKQAIKNGVREIAGLKIKEQFGLSGR